MNYITSRGPLAKREGEKKAKTIRLINPRNLLFIISSGFL